VSTSGLVDTKQPKRRQYSEALKRQMVAETQVSGASVSIVARRHDVNSNQLFRWRPGHRDQLWLWGTGAPARRGQLRDGAAGD